jgi:hypothetical protein
VHLYVLDAALVLTGTYPGPPGIPPAIQRIAEIVLTTEHAADHLSVCGFFLFLLKSLID